MQLPSTQAGAPSWGASDLASGLSAATSIAQASGTDAGNNFLSGAASGASMGGTIGLFLGPEGAAAGAAIGGALGGVAALFSGKKTDEAQQSADINRVAANNGITGAEAAAVIAYHANHSSDHFNDLAANVAGWNERFLQLLDEYNHSGPPQTIQVGSVKRAQEQTASAQQKWITTALTTANFASTATGQQFIASLQGLPASQVVGTQGQTIGQILDAMLNGASKGAGDAVAETAWGKKFKWSYVKDWFKENQLLAAGLAIIAGLGLITVVNIVRGKHGKITL